MPGNNPPLAELAASRDTETMIHPMYTSATTLALFIAFMCGWCGCSCTRNIVEIRAAGEKYRDLNNWLSGVFFTHSSNSCNCCSSPLARDISKLRTWNGFLFGSALMLAWIGTGMVWYAYSQRFTWAQSFFYSIETGYSIGYGALEEEGDGSRLFTISHVLLGSTLIAGLLSSWVFAVSERERELYKHTVNKMVSRLAKDGWHKDYGQVARNERNSAIVQGCFQSGIVSAIALQGWLLIGALFAILRWKTTIVEGYFFAVTGLSTAGLYAPATDSISMLFTGVFSLIGVPLYAFQIASWGELFFACGSQATMQQKLRHFTLCKVPHFHDSGGGYASHSDGELSGVGGQQGEADVREWARFLEFVMEHCLDDAVDFAHLRSAFAHRNRSCHISSRLHLLPPSSLSSDVSRQAPQQKWQGHTRTPVADIL